MNPSIEQTIDRVEELYAAITGHSPPLVDGNLTRIPPETDPARFVEEQLARLLATLDQRLAPAPQRTWTPEALAWQTESAFELAVAVPGAARERIELWLDGGALVVRGEAPAGAFTRAFPLPGPVAPGDITARLDAGLLRVRVVRRAQAERSQIAISCS